MSVYEGYLVDIMTNGVDKSDRTGTGARSVFGRQMRFNLADGFPLITTKRVPFRLIATELVWFLRGMTNVKWLQERNCHIWDEWADENGDLGPVYGAQWRSWPTFEMYSNDSTGKGTFYPGESIDQIANVIHQINTNPNSRRMLVSAWNPAQIDEMKLPPCHCLFQFYVADGKLSCQLYQRSCDSFLGVPFNIASYALLTHLIAHHCELGVSEFIWTGGDCHIYSNHFDQVAEQLKRTPRPFPQLVIPKGYDFIEQYEPEDFELHGYDPHPVIKAPVAV